MKMLKLDDNKTELMLVTSKRTKHLHNLPTSISIGNAQFPFKQSVKNLDFTFDCHHTMNAHVTTIARICYFELCCLTSICIFLTSTETATLQCSSCNLAPSKVNISTHIKSLHWVPVKVRSTYKIDCLCYHCHSSTAPSYVSDMLQKKPSLSHTCSSSYTLPLLNGPAHSMATLGDRLFSRTCFIQFTDIVLSLLITLHICVVWSL